MTTLTHLAAAVASLIDAFGEVAQAQDKAETDIAHLRADVDRLHELLGCDVPRHG